MKRKVVSIILACTMLFGVAASTFAVSAAEVDTSLPPSVSKEDMAAAASKIDSTLASLIGLENLLTNQTVSQIVTMLVNLMASIQQKVTPASYWEALCFVDKNPFDPYCNEESWENVDMASLDWGVIPGDADTFIDAVVTVLSPFSTLLVSLGMDTPGEEPPEEPVIDPAIPIPMPLYRFFLYPVYQAFGVEGLQEPAAWSAKIMELISSGVSMPDELLGQARQAFIDGDMDAFNSLMVQVKEESQAFGETIMELMDMIGAPIFDLLRNLLKAPVTTLLENAPNLENVFKTVDLDWLWGLVAPDMTEKPNSLVGVLNTVLGMVNINGTTLDITLPDYDFTAWNDLDNTDRLTAFMNYAVEVIRADGNAAAITALVPENLQGVVNTVLGLDDNSIKHFLVNFIAYNKMEFTPPETTTDPKGEEPTTKPSAGDPTEPTETTTGGGTTGGANSQPDTGDTAMAAVAFTGLLAAGACVLLFKKKSSL